MSIVDHAPRRRANAAALAITGLLLVSGCAQVAIEEPVTGPSSRRLGAAEPTGSPPSLAELKKMAGGTVAEDGAKQARLEVLRSEGMAFGARGGLAKRYHEINRHLESRGAELDTTFRFSALSITAPGGALVMPPVVTMMSNASNVADDGQSASMADRVFAIVEPGKIVNGEPDWRTYLVRQWDAPEPPHKGALPKADDAAEQKAWDGAVEMGWVAGRQQADRMFEELMNRLVRDFEGMVEYHRLVQEGKITQFHVATADRGITGGGDVMRVGAKEVRIVQPARLNPRAVEWEPVIIRAPMATKR